MVRCVECGYLSIRDKNSQQLEEAGPKYRETGNAPKLSTGYPLWDPTPICLKREFNLEGEMKSIDASEVLRVISQERPCAKSTPYIRGRSPQEHRDKEDMDKMMQTQAEIRERDRQWQEQVRKEDREWQERVRREDLEWKARQDEMVRKQHAETTRQNFRTFWIIGIVGMAVMSAVYILAALIQANYFKLK